jgi:AraC-like DNA-binding protein
MPFVFNKYSGLLLIFFVHGLVYALLLFRKGIKNDTVHDKWLAFFLLLCIFFICPWMLGFAGWYDGYTCLSCRNFLFYMPFQQSLLMGPVIYCYIQGRLNPNFQVTKMHWLHFIPGIIYNSWILIVAIVDRLILKRYYLMDGKNDPDFNNWYVALGLVSLLVYLYLSFKYYQHYKTIIYHELSFADDVTFKWIRNFLIAFFIYFFSSLIVGLLDFFDVDIKYTDSWWYYLLFAIIFYYIAITGYSNSIVTKAQYHLAFLQQQLSPLLPNINQDRAIIEAIIFEDITENQPVGKTKNTNNSEAMDEWKAKILQAVFAEKLYQNPELTLTDLSKHLATKPSLLSKIINQGFAMNFNDFINWYRVEEIKQQLKDGAYANRTIMSLAYDAGFNSKATFNRAFKKATGKNPKEFLPVASNKVSTPMNMK